MIHYNDRLNTCNLKYPAVSRQRYRREQDLLQDKESDKVIN
jgi:hypothetical protein